MTHPFFAIGILVLHLVCAEKVTVTTSFGDVIGNIKEEEVNRFEEYLGIPFAKPPVGNLRFQIPLEPEPFSQPYEANTFSSACFQQSTFPGSDLESEVDLGVPVSEDCLYLNVWTPSSTDGKLRPVLVWVHGGGFAFGAASQKVYHGALLAAMEDVVVVSVNYRLGIFGFLSSGTPDAPGNMGMLDQRLALVWVKENIKKFGGDPDLVTIFGESAGSMAVGLLILSPLSKGLFRRGILMSGTNYVPSLTDPPQKSLLKGNNVAKAVGCATVEEDLRSHPEKVLPCLRLKSADELQKTAEELASSTLVTFLPTFSDPFCPKAPILMIDRGEFNNVDVFVGTTSQEAVLFLSFVRPEYLSGNLNNFTTEELIQNAKEIMLNYNVEPVKEAIEFYLKDIDKNDKRSICTELINYFSDYLITCPSNFFSERYSDKGNNVYLYRFSQMKEDSPVPESVGVPHFFDVPFVFGRPFAVKGNYTDKDRDFSRQVMKTFADFARTGHPALPGGAEWPKYSRKNPEYVEIKLGNTTPMKDLRKAHCDVLRKFI